MLPDACKVMVKMEAVSKVTDTASFWHYTSCFFERSHF